MNLQRSSFIFFTLVTILLLISCQDKTSSCSYELVISEMSFENGIYDATTKVENVSWSGDCLNITFTYTGGCDEHEFEIVSAGDLIKTNPPIITLGILHDNKDACDSVITETIEVDILSFPEITNLETVFIKFKDDPDFSFLLEL